MDGAGPQHSLSDSELDRELETALGIEPSPEFLAQVRTRVAAETAVPLWCRALWGRGAQPLVPAAIVAGVLAVVIPRMMRDDAVLVKPVAPVIPQVASEVIKPAVDVAEAPVTTAARAVSGPIEHVEDGMHVLPLQLSPVLFGDDDRRTFALYVAAVTEGRVPDEVRATSGEEMTALSIMPLTIDPLPVLARLDRQGEGQW